MRSAGLPSINVRSHKIASSRNGADSERRYQVSHARFQQTSDDVINAHTSFEHRFRADLEGLKDCISVPLFQPVPPADLPIDVHPPRVDEINHGAGAVFCSVEIDASFPCALSCGLDH